MLVVDTERSEKGPQRRRHKSGRLLHCCCMCGRLDIWRREWSYYGSYKEEEDGVPLPKFCSEDCRKQGGPAAAAVTDEMKAVAKAAEWREPDVAYRQATEKEKYREALHSQRTKPPVERMNDG